MELKRYWTIICERKWILIQAILIVSGIAIIACFAIRPIYKASSKLMLTSKNIQIQFVPNLPENLGSLRLYDSIEDIETYKALIQNTSSLNKVIKHLDLKDNKGKLLEAEQFIINTAKLPRFILIQKKGVQITTTSRTSDVLEIIGYSPQPEEAVKIANGVVESFSELFHEIYRNEAVKARTILERNLPRVRTELSLAQKAEEAYLTQNELTSISFQTKTLISEISTLENKLNTTQTIIEQNRSNLRYIRDALGNQASTKDAQTPIENNSLIENYKKQLTSLEVELANLSLELASEHPHVRDVQNQIDMLEKKIKKGVETIAFQTAGSNPYAEYYKHISFDALVAQYANLEIDTVRNLAAVKVLLQQLNRKKRDLESLPKKGIELSFLQEKSIRLMSLYLSLLESIQYAKIAESMEISNIVKIHPASLSFNIKNDVYFPDKELLAVISLFLGLTFGLFLVFLMEYLDDTVKTPGDVRKALRQPLLGVVPKTSRNGMKINISQSINNGFSNSIWNLTANIKLAAKGRTPKVLSVISTANGEGKTTIALHLAAVAAQAGQRALLIDSNLRRPKLRELLGLTNDDGLSDFLENRKELEKVIFPTNVKQLDLIPSGLVPSNPLKLLCSPQMTNLIKPIRGEYDLIIFDTCSIEDGSDPVIVSTYVDKIIVVLASGHESAEKIENALEHLHKENEKLLGVILNKVKKPHL